MSQSQAASPRETCSSIIELRQYTLRPGKRDILIDIFEREFIEAQESAGIEIIGQFRDLDNPDRFVWLRGYPDMSTRPRTLEAFYTSAAWKARRDEINEILVDYSNVLLLRPAWPGSGFPPSNRPANRVPMGLVTATICPLNSTPGDEFLEFFNDTLKPTLTEGGAPCLAAFVNELSANNYPRLPLREGENVFVWFTFFATQISYDRHISALTRSSSWPHLRENLQEWLIKPFETLKLNPARRSRLG